MECAVVILPRRPKSHPQSRQRYQRMAPSVPKCMPLPGQSGQRGAWARGIMVGLSGRGQRGPRLAVMRPSLQEAAFREGNQLIARHDEVVDDSHVHQRKRAFQVRRQELVGAAGFGKAARMVVGERHRRRVA